LGYSREQLALCEGATIPDLLGDDCRLLVVGINPGLQTAMTGIHFAHPSNRFWPALKSAGIIDWAPTLSPAAPAVPLPGARVGRSMDPRSAAAPIEEPGMTVAQMLDFTSKGLGITNLVPRATARASELSAEELRAGGERLAELVRDIHPSVVAIAGVTAFRDAFGRRRAGMGLQPESMEGAAVWVVPNPSGLNAHETIDSLAGWYGRVAAEAGVT